MKRIIQTFLLLFIPFAVQAQIIDESDFNKLQQGNYSIEKGKIQVTFTDTTTSDFAIQELGKKGYEVLSSTFQPIMLRVTHLPEGITPKDLEDHKWVDFILHESVGIDDEDLRKMKKKDSTVTERQRELLEQFKDRGNYQFLMVGLTYGATKDALADLEDIHPELKFEVALQSERSAVIKTETDKELEAMDELQSLPFVLNTAMMGSIE
ncbi:MAG: hypothetical protein CL666_16455 [Balneola sp.]|nr:hypothetical protein [Balneola sp.]|tara:strand:- start:122407 stop:123033 length:627 start_codon:yes stop_codon:yes gene_type:complete